MLTKRLSAAFILEIRCLHLLLCRLSVDSFSKWPTRFEKTLAHRSIFLQSLLDHNGFHSAEVLVQQIQSTLVEHQALLVQQRPSVLAED